MTGWYLFRKESYQSRCIVLLAVLALCGGRLSAVETSAASETAGHQVIALTNISAERGREFLGRLTSATASKLPGSNALLVTAEPSELQKATTILNLVDSRTEFDIKELGPASAGPMPSNPAARHCHARLFHRDLRPPAPGQIQDAGHCRCPQRDPRGYRPGLPIGEHPTRRADPPAKRRGRPARSVASGDESQSQFRGSGDPIPPSGQADERRAGRPDHPGRSPAGYFREDLESDSRRRRATFKLPNRRPASSL